MKINCDDLRRAVAAGVLQPGQDEALWEELRRRPETEAQFSVAHLSYYAGALVVMGAMGWFITKAWETLPGLALTAVACAYAVVFILASRWVWDRLELRIPGGLLLTMAVAMTPLGIYGVLRQFGLWPQGDPGAYQGFHVWVQGSWIALELGTVLAGLVALRYRRFPFLVAPIAVALWYLSMDLTPLLIGTREFSMAEREWVSTWFGLAMLVGAYAVDLRGRDEDFAFWIHLAGVLAFWGGLSMMNSDSELGKFCYFLINLAMLLVSVLLRRAVYLIFGALGAMGYIGHLAYRVFDDSLLFSVALTIIGVSMIALGMIYQRNSRQIEQWLRGLLPDTVHALLPARARS